MGRMGIIKSKTLRFASSAFFDKLPLAHEMRSKIFKNILRLEYTPEIHKNVIIRIHHLTTKGFEKINKYGLVIGKNCVLKDKSTIDISGNVILGDNVNIGVNSILYSHYHSIYEKKDAVKEKVVLTTLEIGDHAVIGNNVMIMGSCVKIGRLAEIKDNSVIRNNIPPYSIIQGNPAKIVGFMFNPQQMVEFENSRYNPEDRTDVDKYNKYFKKYSKNK